MAVQKLSLKRFLTHVKDRHEGEKERPFCYILGAGASVQSEIPTGGQLVDGWLSELHTDEAPAGESIAAWTEKAFSYLPNFTYSRRAEFYGDIYARQFRGREKAGHVFLERELIGKEPSFGYSILASILANTQHKAVITTNFDNPVSDALFLYSNTAPIICGHESLAGYVTPRLHRPLIVKIHRDILLQPRNKRDEIDALDRAWHEPLRVLLGYFTPIFIGYGGNDGSLMGFLENLPAEIPDSIYWCAHTVAPPNARVEKLLDKRDGFLIEIPGFDELMLLLTEKLNIPDLLPDWESRHRSRVERYRNQFAELRTQISEKSMAPDATNEQRAVSKVADAFLMKQAHRLAHRAPGCIFVSYASPDLPIAEYIVKQLQDKGLLVWFDRQQLLLGKDWEAEFSEAVETCGVFLSLISDNSAPRLEGFNIKERNLAIERREQFPDTAVFYIPIRIDEGEPLIPASEPRGSRKITAGRKVGGHLDDAFIEYLRQLQLDYIKSRGLTFTPPPPIP